MIQYSMAQKKAQDNNRLHSGDRDRGGGGYTTNGCGNGCDDAGEPPNSPHSVQTAGCNVTNSSLDASSNRAYMLA